MTPAQTDPSAPSSPERAPDCPRPFTLVPPAIGRLFRRVGDLLCRRRSWSRPEAQRLIESPRPCPPRPRWLA